jgi:hypothetical protein
MPYLFAGDVSLFMQKTISDSEQTWQQVCVSPGAMKRHETK